MGSIATKVRKAVARNHRLLRPFLRDRYRPHRVPGGLVYLNLKESKMMLERVLGVYEIRKTEAVRDLLEPGMTFLDIGANKGDFTLLASREVGEEGAVLAFEPEPENRLWLEKSIELNDYRNVTVFPQALSDTDGTQRFHLCATSGGHSLKDGYFDEVGALEVETRRLDGLLAELGLTTIDLAKIDVEGAELEVLRGARETLERSRDAVLLIDLHPQKGVDPLEIEAFLEDLGFRAYRMRRPYDRPAGVHAETRELLARRG